MTIDERIARLAERTKALAQSAKLLRSASRQNGKKIRALLRTAEIQERRAAAAILGRRGGQSKTEAKAEAARENGALGGRPLKPVRCPCGEMTLKRAKARGHKC